MQPSAKAVGALAGNGQSQTELPADRRADWRSEPAFERVGQLLQSGLPQPVFSAHQQLPSGATVAAFGAPQPASLSIARRPNLLRTLVRAGPLPTRKQTCACLRRELSREPDAGNPPVRFDEGRR